MTMGVFRPCVSRNACTEDGTHCRACGRSHEEIGRLRILTRDLAAFVVDAGYENVDEFLAHFTAKVGKKVAAARQAE